MGRRAGRGHRGRRDRQDAGHRRAGAVAAGQPRGPAPGTDPRPDLQREGRAGAPGTPGQDGRHGHARPDRRLELPQLLPSDPDRERGRRGVAGAAGRARRGRPGRCCCATSSPTCRSSITRAGSWTLDNFVGFINRAKDELVEAGRVRRLRRRGAARVRGALRELRGRRRPPRDPGQPRSRCAEVRGAYASVRQNERAEARGETPDYDRGRLRQDRRPRGPPHRRRHRARRSGGTRSTASDHPRIDTPHGDLRRRWRRARGRSG